MKSFYEFITHKENDTKSLLDRIVANHGHKFRSVLAKLISDGDLDDDPEMLRDIKQLCNSLKDSDQAPPQNDKPNNTDVIATPKADTGSNYEDGDQL
jgi:hypothetical protein